MADVWGNALRLSIFGESHGPAVGIVVDGLPPGLAIDFDAVESAMLRRAPGRDKLSTARRETDHVEILSGLFDGKTTGSPICGIIRNSDARSGDYGTKLRPGHADMTALLKYGGCADMRGGGHFSGRLTAPLVFAGSLARHALARYRVEIYGRIASIAGIDDPPPDCDSEVYREIAAKEFPVAGYEAGERMRQAILEAKSLGDSVGGIIEVAAFGVPAGLGEPFFAPMESSIASLLFSIPAIKAVEFGDGFALAAMRGSAANDPIIVNGRELQTSSNHNGGILGGITNGMPLVVRAAVKPTPSIAQEQNTVNSDTMEPAKLQIKGRHDPCIVPRALPAAEAAVALCVLDAILSETRYKA